MRASFDISSVNAAAADIGLQLPFDRLKKPGIATRLEAHVFDFAPPASDAAARLAAVFAVQLARYTGQISVPLLVSTLASGRGLRWAIQVDTDPNTPCETLLSQVRHGCVPLESASLAKESIPAAILITDSLSLADGAHALELLRGSPLRDAGADLHLIVAAGADKPRAAWAYNANLFESATIARFTGHFATLLAHFAAQSTESIGSLPLLAPGERNMVRAVGEGRARPYSNTLIHHVVEQRAAATPNAVAVRFSEQTLTYAELNAQANRLARHFLAQGIGAESRVSVCVEPGFDIAIALLAVLKAGGVYVPLEPTYPEARIRMILEDTRPQLILSRMQLAERLKLKDFPLFRMDADAAVLEAYSPENPDIAVDLQQTAYIFYTSGTTGKPKGVMASHANLIQYILSAQQRYEFSAQDIMPAIARFSFSISLLELLSPLAAGGTLLILERDHVIDLARLAQTLREVTFFHAGPSLLRGVVAYIRHRYADFAGFDKVRHASSGGDMVPPELLESLKEIFQRAEVFVIYGCSEVSCMGCTYPVARDRVVTRTYVGSPFDNVVVRILDLQRRLVPFGIVGEICFAGGGVVKGYLNRPQLTEEKFIDVDGQRFYCTGDMGRVNAAGEIEILGRRDFQIQLRGMRVELGEIEYALRKAPGVRDGVVMARDDGGGEKALVAYLVFQPEHGSDRAAVREHMRAHLPDYMVPALYMELDKLPLNHNMKVDRHALPAPQTADRRAALAARIRQAETATERELAQLWKTLLRVDEVGLDDNFFELGGHSMLAVELILEVERRLNVTLEGMEVLRESLEVVASLADQRSGRAAKAASVQAPVQRGGETLECFHFGPNRSLYGVIHGSEAERAEQALLICSPVGQENVRCHFILHKLSRQLAARGIPVLRFDYYGCGNSLGDNIEGSCHRWQQDVVEAFHELKRRAPAARVAVFGVRLGATLACSVSAQLDAAQLIVWDPVEKGAEHAMELENMHRARVRGLQNLRLGRRPRRMAGGCEYLGFTWSDAALDQLRRLEMTSAHGGVANTVRRIERSDYDCRWNDIACLDDVLPDVGFSRRVVELLGAAA